MPFWCRLLLDISAMFLQVGAVLAIIWGTHAALDSSPPGLQASGRGRRIRRLSGRLEGHDLSGYALTMPIVTAIPQQGEKDCTTPSSKRPRVPEGMAAIMRLLLLCSWY
jgi:hypothetical protein